MVTKRKMELLRFAVLIILGLSLCIVLGILNLKLQEAAAHIAVTECNIYRALIGLILTFCGVLIEWKTLFSCKQKRVIKISYLLGALFLIVFPMIPFETVAIYCGLPTVHSIKGVISLLHFSAYTRALASIFGGILLIRSFTSVSRVDSVHPQS